MRDGKETSLLPTELFRCHSVKCSCTWINQCMNDKSDWVCPFDTCCCDEMKWKICAALIDWTRKTCRICGYRWAVAIAKCNVSWIMISDYRAQWRLKPDAPEKQCIRPPDTQARRAASRIEVTINIFQRTITNKLTFNLHHISWRSVLTHFKLKNCC